MKKYLMLIVFLFVVGIYNVQALEIPVNSYVIGEYLFTRDGSNSYNGQLSTDYIMLASKSISSKDLDDMVIYFKIADGQYINGATGEEIDDSFLEHDLAEKIKYYDMKKIPSVRVYAETGYHLNDSGYFDGTVDQHSFNYNVYDKDETNNLEVGVDFYGSSNINISSSELSAIYYPNQEGFSDMNLKLMELNTGGLSGNIGTRVEYSENHQFPTVEYANSKYTVFAYPYVNVVSKSGQTKKVYLEFQSSNVVSVNKDLTVNKTFENGKVKISVVDPTGKKYKILSAMLYKSYQQPGNHNSLDIYDLVGLYKQIETKVPEYKGMFNEYTSKALKEINELYNNQHREIVDLYSATTNIQSNMVNEVELYDLGNSENASIIANDEISYVAYAQVVDDDDHVYDVSSDTLMTFPTLVKQLVVDDNYIQNEDRYMDLFQMILMFNMLYTMSE